jgi:hypothetical protein
MRSRSRESDRARVTRYKDKVNKKNGNLRMNMLRIPFWLILKSKMIIVKLVKTTELGDKKIKRRWKFPILSNLLSLKSGFYVEVKTQI